MVTGDGVVTVDGSVVLDIDQVQVDLHSHMYVVPVLEHLVWLSRTSTRCRSISIHTCTLFPDWNNRWERTADGNRC